MAHDNFLWELTNGRGSFGDKIKLTDHGKGVSILNITIPDRGVFNDKWNSSYGGEFEQRLASRYHGELGITTIQKWSSGNETRSPLSMHNFIALPKTAEMKYSTVAHVFQLMRAKLFTGDILVAIITVPEFKTRRARILFKKREDLLIWDMIFAQNATERGVTNVRGQAKVWDITDIRRDILGHVVDKPGTPS